MTAHPLRRLVASRWAPWLLLGISLVADVVATAVSTDPFNTVDLAVYLDGARHLTDGSLYDFLSGTLHLPFTYPPFAALLFEPARWLPWTLTRLLWHGACLAALPAIMYLTLRLLGRAGREAPDPLPSLPGILVTGTALGMWLEPVRTNLNYGQINLFLAVLVLGAAATTRNALAGALVGLAAGIKLVPAITGVYLLATRRLAAALWSAAFFAASVVVMLAIIPRQTWRYFTRLIFDPARTGPIYSAINQSWRGALARLAGHDVSTSWLVVAALTVGLGLWALRSTTVAGDSAGALLAVQFLALLVSPISWSHHWVWVLPLLVWGVFGARSGDRRVRWLLVGWLVGAFSYLVPILVAIQGTVPVDSRPGWQSGLGLIYPLLGIWTLVVLAAGRPGPGARRLSFADASSGRAEQ